MTSSALADALDVLSGPHREVLILRFYEDMKIHEIAAHLGISSGTVKSRLHYAIAEMQRRLPSELNLFGPCGTEEKAMQ
jgi:RNA polymerase sigma-70 factor (ECF subfamily)